MAFEITSSMKEIVKKINEIKLKLLESLLKKVVQSKLQHQFTVSELTKLSEVLFESEEVKKETTILQVNQIIEFCRFVIQQAGYHTVHGIALQVLLTSSAGMKPRHAELFSLICSAENLQNINEENKTSLIFGCPSVLNSVEWKFHINLSNDGFKSRDYYATLNFDLIEEECTSNQVDVEFSHEDLFSFFQKLEIIQQQLDSYGV